MIPAPMFKHTRLTASQRAEDRACPDGAPEVDRCECGEVATIKCGRERFCISCQLDIDRANLSVEDEAVRMNSEGAD